ncbi:MAG: hypothetical protein LBS70_09790 [Candidatus Accumulibacter sp.]|jgi:hypothetical protein|nr:hypothetical protein [Accumulibacter sp.]
MELLLILFAAGLTALMVATTVTAWICGRYAISQGVDKSIVRTWFRRGVLLYLAEMPVNLLGLIVVALALPFRRETSEGMPFSQYPEFGAWRMIELPGWAKWWSNPCDGLIGDKRGWFGQWCVGHRIPYPSALSMWWWAAVRNPANYFSRVTTAIDITGATLKLLAGTSVYASESDFGWHFIVAERDGKTLAALFQAAIPYPFFDRRYGFYCRFGYKIELDEPQTAENDLYDRLRSSVWKMSLWKDLT